MKAVRWWLAAGAMLLGSMSVYGCSDESDARDGFDNSSSSGGRRRGSSSGDESSSGGSSSGSNTASSSGGNSASSSSGGGSSSSSSGGEEPDAGVTSSSSSSGGSSSSSGGSNPQCTPLVPGEFLLDEANPTTRRAYYQAYPDDVHTLYLDFYNASGEGQVVFGVAPENNFLTCENCLVLEHDVTGKTYFATGGTMAIAAGSSIYEGFLNATLTNVTLAEIDDDSLEPIPGGACFSIANAPIAVDERP